MRDASTPARTEEILQLLRGSNLKTHVYLEREVTAQEKDWTLIDDLDGSKGVNWSKSAKKYKWATPSLTPKASTIDFSVLNKNAEYSEGSGQTNSGAFGIDTRIRLNGGYILNNPKDSVVRITDDFTGSESTFHNTQLSGGEVVLDSSGSTFTTNYFNDLFPTNGSVTYLNNEGYTATGYYIFTKNFTGHGIGDVKTLRITGNDTKWKMYWRSITNLSAAQAGNNDSTHWTLLGSSSAVEQEFSLSSADCQYFQVALVADGVGSWGDSTAIVDINFDYDDYFEAIYKDVFYLDNPSFTDPKAPAMPMVNCKGRDLWKRANENEVNLKDMTAGVTVTQLIKDVCDQVNIKYGTSSIVDLSAFDSRDLATGLGEVTKVDKVFEIIMQVITQGDSGDRYQMYLEYDSTEDDNILFVTKKPDTYLADFVFNYNYYESIGNSGRDYDKVFNRITIFDASTTVDKQQELAALTNYTTTGNKTLSWTGDAVYKQPIIDIKAGSSSDVTVTLLDVNNTDMQFTIAGTTIDVDITVNGCKFSSGSPTYYAEWFDLDNFLTNVGTTYKINNLLVRSDAECKLMARGLIGDFGTPRKEANNMVFPYTHLMMEVNDMVMLWARFIFIDNLYYITGIKYHWDNSKSPSDNTVFNLEDSGLNFSDISTYIYDDVLDYDIGYVYDMGISTPLSTKEEIDAASVSLMQYDLEVT